MEIIVWEQWLSAEMSAYESNHKWNTSVKQLIIINANERNISDNNEHKNESQREERERYRYGIRIFVLFCRTLICRSTDIGVHSTRAEEWEDRDES